MSELRLRGICSRDKLGKVFFEEAAQLDHNHEEFFTRWTVLNDETLKCFVVFDYWVTLLFVALIAGTST